MKDNRHKSRIRQVGDRWQCEGLGYVSTKCCSPDLAYYVWVVIIRSRGI